MKRFCGMAAGIVLLAIGVAAQDTRPDQLKQMKLELEKVLATSKMVAAGGGVMGSSVKGAPYSGQEVNENTQVLGDGTRIHNESRTKVFRDGEGRVRREFGDQVTIWDPVANVNYMLNTKTMTAMKSPMGGAVFMRTFPPPGPGGAGGTVAYGRGMVFAETVEAKEGTVTVSRDGKTETFPAGQEAAVWAGEDGKVKAKLKQAAEADVLTYGPANVRMVEREVSVTKDGKKTTAALPEEGHFTVADRFEAGVAMPVAGMPMPAMPMMATPMPMMNGTFIAGSMALRSDQTNFKTEELGEQVMEGVKVHGSKQTSTLEAGAIGNDRPLTTVSERWFSDELKTEVMTRRSDPRTGEQTFRLITINRGEPGSYLFQVPSGYTMAERK